MRSTGSGNGQETHEKSSPHLHFGSLKISIQADILKSSWFPGMWRSFAGLEVRIVDLIRSRTIGLDLTQILKITPADTRGTYDE